MSKWTPGLAGWSAVALAVGAAGMVIAGHSSGGLTTGQWIATFATNVFGGLGVDALKKLYGTFVERPGRPIDENHVILRNLRAAQLKALSDVADRYDRASVSLTDRGQAAKADAFSSYLRDYLAREGKLALTLTAADLAEPTGEDALAIRAALIARAPGDFNVSLSARHGAGPAIEAFRGPAEDAMLAELRALVQEDLPAAFQRLLRGSDDGTDGWFALFIRDAAKRLRGNAEFERIWQGEQTAAIRVLAESIGASVTALSKAIGGQSKALQTLGSQLDEIAGDAWAVRTLMSNIAGRLQDTAGWLDFNAAFEPKGWLRFHAFNRAIPFHGREGELSALHGFLNHADPFRWWIVTSPGGAGKTRLALELCLRAHVNGWQVGFLRKKFTPPAMAWRPNVPTLIIADYAAQEVETVRALAVQLAQIAGRPEQPVVRLLMLERRVDEVFLNRFLGSGGKEAGALIAWQHAEPPLALADLSEDDVWSLVQPCPWRSDGRAVGMGREQFFGHLDGLDASRRALVAMLLADAAAEQQSGLSFTTLGEVLKALVANARAQHWPRLLGANAEPVGAAVPADVLIATATMAGHIGHADIDKIEASLGKEISDGLLDDCARAIGSPLYPDIRRLDGIQPDLIGEYFALEVLKPDRGNRPRFPWLPELAWRVDEIAMAAFVTRARQNFPDHGRALSQIGITIPGKTESWWLDVLPILAGDRDSGLLSRLHAAYNRLIGPAATDTGAAAALARLCWFATGQDRSVVPFTASESWVLAALGLPPCRERTRACARASPSRCSTR